MLDEAVQLARAQDDTALIAEALMHAGLAHHRAGAHMTARAVLEESLAVRRRVDRRSLGPSLSALGYLALDQGDHAGARAYFEERIGRWRELGDQQGLALATASLGELALAQHERAEARRLFTEALLLWRANSEEPLERGSLSLILACFAWLAAEEGEPERAIRLAAAATSFQRAFGYRRVPSLRMRMQRLLAMGRSAASGAAATTAWADGSGISLEQAVAEALAVGSEAASATTSTRS